MGSDISAKRVLVPAEKCHCEELSSGVVLGKFYPGGKGAPNGEVHADKPGGQAWSEHLLLGDSSDAFQLMLPDIRMPANQYWPLHWHDTWTVVLVLEGSCTIGDWQMVPGDIFITVPSLEYGPLLIGPSGCRLFEIFAQGHLAAGGYSPEYRDHPTLQGVDAVFKERSALNKRNEGRQILALQNGVEGVWKTRLTPGAQWDLGDSEDPDRGFMADTRLAEGEIIPAHRYGDWHALFVLNGSLEVGGKTLTKDSYLIVKPDSKLAEITAGAEGVHLLELARTSRGADRLPVA